MSFKHEVIFFYSYAYILFIGLSSAIMFSIAFLLFLVTYLFDRRLVLLNLFFPFRWVSKAEVFLLPFIGWNMMINGHVKLKRGDKKSIKIQDTNVNQNNPLFDCYQILNERVTEIERSLVSEEEFDFKTYLYFFCNENEFNVR